MRSFVGRDILSLKDMERDDYIQIFRAAGRLAPHAAERRHGDLLQGKTVLGAIE
jgi:aspartate carbamoyltransferase catalytic subunit